MSPKANRLSSLFLSGLAAVLFCSVNVPARVSAQTDYGEIALRVAKMLEEEHYQRHLFDDEISERLLDNYIEYLDYSRVYFTQEDIDRFYNSYRHTLDDDVLRRDLSAAYDIYGVYKERVRSRVTLVKELLGANDEFHFDSDRSIQISRKDTKWPADDAASDQLWHDLIEGDLLQETLRKDSEDQPKPHPAGATPDLAPEKKAGEKKETPREIINKRYTRILDSVNENDAEDVAVMFIKSLSRAYDPHSEYFSQSQYDNFRIGMNKSLIGIGAMLSTEEDGSASIQGLVVGGPAHKGGDLQVMDRIVGVGQGEEGEVVDTIDMKLNEVVDLIRGEKGTIVRLKVIPAESHDGAKTNLISIVRDKVDLKDSLASAELIITRDSQGNPMKLGWINLLSFYSDMDGGNTSTTADVQRLVTRLMSEGIQGLVVDLRDNGGGSLEEAINMTGLFIPRGPVVQSQDWQHRVDYKASRARRALWEGPMVVLTNRSSASASEIFAAALQDYQRALIVGEKSTFGKGTVQQLRPVQTTRLLLPFRPEANLNGALKLTIQTFFRINGDSTQLKGVIPDVHLPSTNDVLDIGESALSYPLEVKPIRPEVYEPVRRVPLPVNELATRLAARLAEDQEFKYIQEDVNEAKKRIEENTLTLNRQQREAEAKQLDEKREARKQERIKRFARMREEEKELFTVYGFTQNNVQEPGLTLQSELANEESSGMMTGMKKDEDPDSKALEYPHGFDPYKRQSVFILQDLITIENSQNPVDISTAIR